MVVIVIVHVLLRSHVSFMQFVVFNLQQFQFFLQNFFVSAYLLQLLASTGNYLFSCSKYEKFLTYRSSSTFPVTSSSLAKANFLVLVLNLNSLVAFSSFLSSDAFSCSNSSSCCLAALFSF